jgi:hypothetical protein
MTIPLPALLTQASLGDMPSAARPFIYRVPVKISPGTLLGMVRKRDKTRLFPFTRWCSD